MSQIPKFCEELKNRLGNLRLNRQGQVRIIPDDASREVKIQVCFVGEASRRGTLEFRVSYHAAESQPAIAQAALLQSIAQKLNQDGLLVSDPQDAFTSPEFRVVRVTRQVFTPGGGVRAKDLGIKVEWQGSDPMQCTLRLGVAETRKDPTDPDTFIIVEYVLQKWQGSAWVDIPKPSRAVSPGSLSNLLPDSVAALAQYSFQPDPDPTPTELKKQRAAQAFLNRSQKPQTPLGSGRTDDQRKLFDAERARQAEAHRRLEAEERQRRQEEERRKQERLQKIKEAAVAPWLRVQELYADCKTKWEVAAMHEAEARSTQVEADLFGGVDDHLDAGEKWIDAEVAARALLEFAQERLEEAQARREGKGFEAIYEDGNETDQELEREQQMAGQEFVDESEFAAVAKERVGVELKKAMEEEDPGPPSEPPETGDTAMDDLMGLASGEDHLA